MNLERMALAIGAVAFISSCGTPGERADAASSLAEQAVVTSWQDMPAGWDKRLVQDDAQKLCSAARDNPAKAVAERIEKMNQAQKVIYPASGKLVGDWKKGEAVAQSGYGMRVGDSAPDRANGGNCYACHQIQKAELSFGTLGPSLHQYGKVRGGSDAIAKYTYDKIYNAQAFTACSNMPRFGHNGILTPAQISDAVALLLDPMSPVNQ